MIERKASPPPKPAPMDRDIPRTESESESIFGRSTPLVGRLVLALGAMLITVVLFNSVGGVHSTAAANLLIPVVILAVCAWTSYRLVRSEMVMMCAPITWFLIACATYYGFGPLLFFFGTEATVEYVNASWPVHGAALLRTNILNLMGIALIGFAYVIASRVRIRPSKAADSNSAKHLGPVSCLILFLCIGIPVKYFFTVPYELGTLGFVLPGGVSSLRNFVPLAVLVLAYLAITRGSFWWAAFLALIVVDLYVNLLLLGKQEFLRVVIFAFIGFGLGRPGRRAFILMAVALVASYLVLKPVTDFGRAELVRRWGPEPHASLSERHEIVREGFAHLGDGEFPETAPHQGWWSRLCYAGAQSFAMDQYDQGFPGETYRHISYTFVPRLLWADKPIITNVARDFSEILVGRRTTSTAIGLLGEAYWNGGWFMVSAIALGIGALLAFLTQISIHIVRSSRWIYLPCVFLGIVMGIRIDGWLVPDYVAQTSFYICYGIIGYALTSIAIFLQSPPARRELSHG